MPDLTLRPMTPDEFAQWRHAGIVDYARHKVDAGQWPAQDAERRAAHDVDAYLPDGLDTQGMFVLCGETTSTPPRRVGTVWLGPRADLPAGTAWLLDIAVDEDARGHGYGRALLAAAEDVARQAGYTALGLNVFGYNTVARTLYETSGYQVTSQQMQKALTDLDDGSR